MMTKLSVAIAMSVLAALGVATAPAHAEWAIDLFSGVSWTKSADVDVSGRDNNGASARSTFSDVEVDPGSSSRPSWGWASTRSTSPCPFRRRPSPPVAPSLPWTSFSARAAAAGGESLGCPSP
jgi:hypothetical protein